MHVNERGVKENAFDGDPFTGSLEGEVVSRPSPGPVNFDPSHVLTEMALLDSLRVSPQARQSRIHTDTALHHSLLAAYFPVNFASGDLIFTPSDSLDFQEPAIFIAEKDLIIDGRIVAPPGTVFVAGESLRIRGTVEGSDLLFYGHSGISISGSLSGQFLSRSEIEVQEDAYLNYPTTLFTTGEFTEAAPRIVVSEGAVVDGVIVFNSQLPPADQYEGHITIKKGGIVRGGVFNCASTTLEGTVYGSLLSENLYFYEEPSHYTNWLINAEIDRSKRPASLTVPLGFRKDPDLKILSWSVFRSPYAIRAK